MATPNTMSSARTMAVIPRYVATSPRPGVAGAPLNDALSAGACAGDAELVMGSALLLCRGDRELRDHRVMAEPAVLEATHAVRSRRGEHVADDVRVPRHPLRLCDETVVRVVHAEAVVHVGAGDANLDELAGADRGWRDVPRPLVAGRLHHRAGLPEVVSVWRFRERVRDRGNEQHDKSPERR